MTKIQIAANAVVAKVVNAPDDMKLKLVELLSYAIPGSEHMSRGEWSGRSTLFSYEKSTFPAGLLSLVITSLQQMGHQVSVVRKPAPEPLGNPNPQVDAFGITDEYSYQYEAVEQLIRHRQIIAQCATGCHAIGSEILMHDGSFKRVENVVVGDWLMGPDSRPRVVRELHRGRDTMYRITPHRGGNSFEVNAGHILSLEQTNVGEGRPESIHNGRWVNISVADFVKRDKTFRHIHKLHRSRGIDFDTAPPLSVEPYLMGLLLGDGHIRNNSPSITSMDSEIVSYLSEWAASNNMQISVSCPERIAPTYRFVGSRRNESIGCRVENNLTVSLKSYGLVGTGSADKFIPSDYLTATRTDRLEILAGLLDSDGHLHNSGFDFVSKSSRLADGVAFVARSLGFAVSETVKTINSGRYAGNTYYRLSISGSCDKIPTRIARKRAPPRDQIKDHRLSGFTTEALGEADYYGFSVDDDNLYLMRDFTVTHNSGKSRVGCIALAWIKRPTLFITTRSVLMHQMKRTFEDSLAWRSTHGEPELAGIRVGVMGDGEFRPTKTVCVAMVQTIQAKLSDKDPNVRVRIKEILKHYNLVIAEEAHEASGNGYYEVLGLCSEAYYRLALTGTPFMKEDEEANMKLMACSGPVAIRVTEKELIDKGILATPKFKYLTSPTPPEVLRSSNWQRAYHYGIMHNEGRNKLIALEAKRAARYGLSVMILVQRKEHGKILHALIADKDVKVRYIFGESNKDERDAGLKDLGSGAIDVLIGSTILDVGVDVPSVGMVINAGAGKAEVALRQRIGRGLRRKPKGQLNIAYVIDFYDPKNKHLVTHSAQRRAIVEATPGFSENILKSGVDFDFSHLKLK